MEREKKREVCDAKVSYKRQVDRCSAEHLSMSKYKVCERQRERLMDGHVYTARGVQGGGGRDICVLWRGHGWDDMIDLTGPHVPRRSRGDSDR